MSTSNQGFRGAIRSALREELARDDRVFLIGEDIGAAGGVFKVTEGLFGEFGPRRVIDTPISETAIVGATLGAALTGLIPVAELMFSDFTAVAMDQIANQIAKKAYLSKGRERPSLVIRTLTGGGISFGPHHSQSLEAWFAHTPGLVSVMPGTPADAKGLLKSAIRSGRPVLFFEHKALYTMTGEVPDSEFLIPLGKADVKMQGNDITLIACGSTVGICLEAAGRLKAEGSEAEVVDIRTLSPMDSQTIIDSVKKTGRAVIVEEDVGFCGWGSEVAAQIAEQAVYSLKGPVRRVSAPYTPVPFSPPLEKAYVPTTDSVFSAARELLA